MTASCRFAVCWLFVFASAGLLASIARASDEAATCPAPFMSVPSYPPDAVRHGAGGTTRLNLRIDACGRVQEAAVLESSGNTKLDDAALKAAPHWVLSAGLRARAVDGWVPVPVVYSVDNTLVSKPVDWPKTHRRPRYVLTAPPEGYASVAEADAAVHEADPKVVRPPVIGLVHRFVQFEGPSGREFWLFLKGKDGRQAYAARFRPVMQDDVPVVEVASMCATDAESCAAIDQTLLKGLPFAKARK